ncbi:MAG: outer membrane protein transport protein [Thiovulaceae bacterium]|nr:outer membrane protein transport protein [Sulfurimonadaceae bacterium]
MKQTIKLAISASLLFSSTSIFATNGSVLIGIGAKSRSMGGTGIGISHGADSALINPSLIGTIENKHEISFGGTLFMPDVSNSMGQSGFMSATKESAADKSVIPSVSLATKVNNNFCWGVGMWGTAGMGVDYRNSANNFNMVTNLQLMQFGVPLAYSINSFSIGITPILQYGSLDISYSGTLDTSTAFAGGQAPAVTADVGHDEGVSQDLAMGYNIGLSYFISDLTIGLSYKSQIDMQYNGQLSGASSDFANFGLFGGSILSDTLSTPAEIGIGTSYKVKGHTIALDLKQIKWSDAKGYKDFMWENQTVIALGYEYTTNLWALRLGYNYGDSPISEQATNTSDATASAINMFNLLGFPAIVESHFTIGGSYAFDKETSLDLAYTYAPEVTQTYSIAQFAGFGPNNPTQIETKHSQTSLSIGLNYSF